MNQDQNKINWALNLICIARFINMLPEVKSMSSN